MGPPIKDGVEVTEMVPLENDSTGGVEVAPPDDGVKGTNPCGLS